MTNQHTNTANTKSIKILNNIRKLLFTPLDEDDKQRVRKTIRFLKDNTHSGMRDDIVDYIANELTFFGIIESPRMIM